MSTPAEVQAYADETSAFQGVSEKMLVAMEVYLLWLIANPGGTVTQADIVELQDASKCLANCMSEKQLLAAVVVLLSA